MTAPIEALVETGVYVDDLARAEAFYSGVLGLAVHGRDKGRAVFFRVAGAQMLLVFLAEVTKRGDQLPAHGAAGAGHFAFGVPADSLDGWRRRLSEHGVAIEQEVSWPPGGRSLFFRDPAGNLVELLTRGVWGLPAGW